MEDKTITNLNGKIWYRLIKIIYLFALVFFLLGFNYFNYTNNKEFVVDFNKIQTRSMANKVEVKFETGQTIIFDGKPSPEDIEEVAQKLNLDKTQYSTIQLNKGRYIILFLVGNLSILLSFEIIKRIFYYIILGTIKPKK